MDLLTPRLSRRAFNRMALGGCVLSIPGVLPACRSLAPGAVANDGLVRGAPQDHGVDPRHVLSFLDEVAAAGLELHSFMLYRRGHVVAEGWWWPYAASRLHMMHSLTKSVTVCGVALALEERRFALEDKVVGFFADQLPQNVDDKLAAMTVRDLLTMQTGHAEEVSGSVWRQIATSWVAEFFKIPVVYQPGTKFVYTSAASFMLSAIVTRTTGQTMRDYLQPRFFEPLGIRELQWDLSPGGVNPGGNGLSWTTADVLKLGALHAQRGRWQDRQVLSEQWVDAATRPQVPGGEYGYQWWMGPGRVGYALGLFTQLSIVFPEHEAALAITSAIDGSKHLLPHIWRHFPAAFADAAGSAGDAERLAARSHALRLLPELRVTTSERAAAISGRNFTVDANEDGVASVRFDFERERCRFALRDGRGEHVVQVGLADWIEGDTTMTGNKLHHQYQPAQLRVVAGGRWLDSQTFEMTWQFVETAFRDRVICRFQDDRVTLDRSVNVNSAELQRPTVHAQLS